MKILLDTHAFLWAISEPDRLSSRARDILRAGNNNVYFSVASAWEIAIKMKLGKLRLPDLPDRYIPKELAVAAIDVLPIQLSHTLRTFHLPEHHRDPFDRLLIAQAQLENMPLMTSDPHILRYEVTTIW